MSLMYKEKSWRTGFGLGWLTLIGLILVAAKALGFIGWSWWLVTSILWVQLAFVLICALSIGIFLVFKYGDGTPNGPQELLQMLKEPKD